MAIPHVQNTVEPLKKKPLEQRTPARTGAEPELPVTSIEQQAALSNPQIAHPEALIRLQRLAGNHAVTSIIQRRDGRPAARHIHAAEHPRPQAETGHESHDQAVEPVQDLDALYTSPYPLIQRWELSSPFKGQGAHETLTLEALKKAYPDVFKNAKNMMYKDKDAEKAWEYIRGAIWNDDPNAALFWTRKTRGLGIDFGIRFLLGEESESSRTTEGSLTGRSHVGDLQFLHGMADPTEKAIDTKAKMMRWAEFTYKTATGEFPTDTELKDTIVADWFPKQGDWTIAKLFDASSNRSNAAKRAAGSLLHMIEDTFCESHTARTQEGKTKGKITGFRAYGSQDKSKHAEEDTLVRSGMRKNATLKQSAHEGTVNDIIDATAGARQAVDLSADILIFIGKKEKWNGTLVYKKDNIDKTYARGVAEYLDTEVFGLAEGVEQHYAGPGKAFRKSFKDIISDFRSNTSRGWFRFRDPTLLHIDTLLASFEKLDIPELAQTTRGAKIQILGLIDQEINDWLAARPPSNAPPEKKGFGSKLLSGIKTIGKIITAPVYIPIKKGFFKDPDTMREIQILRSIIQEIKRDLESENAPQ